MTNLLAGLSFGAPWILAELVLLPAVWFLLRLTQPMAGRVVFPPVRLLLDLKDAEETPARTPLWLLLLRLAATAIAILALAEPMLGVAPKLSGAGPIVLFVDNGWTAAPNWDARLTALSNAINEAERSNRAIGVVATADASSGGISLLDAGNAERTVRKLEPLPWLPNRAAAGKPIAHTNFGTKPDILWLSDGVEDGHAREIADLLANAGHLRIFSDEAGKGPIGILPPANLADGFSVTLLRSAAAGTRDGNVAALGARDENLATEHFHFDDGRTETTAKLVLPLEVRNETARIVILNHDSAGAVQLMDQGAARRAVGIVSASEVESAQPLLSDVYYLERALSPYADVQKGTISQLLSRDLSVLMLADVGRVSGADHDRVAQFVGNGGVLIRFAGERMTSDVDDLIPVRLRTG